MKGDMVPIRSLACRDVMSWDLQACCEDAPVSLRETVQRDPMERPPANSHHELQHVRTSTRMIPPCSLQVFQLNSRHPGTKAFFFIS